MRKRKAKAWDELWCLIRLKPKDKIEELPEQCEHATAAGFYVVEAQGYWWIFDPPTRFQAIVWVDKHPERERRIRWCCNECGKVMPLGAYCPSEGPTSSI